MSESQSQDLPQSEFDALYDDHVRWSQLRGGKGPMDLSQRSLRHLNLRGRTLAEAELVAVDLEGCDLTGADLSRAKLNSANLRGARLIDCDLYKAELDGADLTRADLSGARLLRTECAQTTFMEATLDRTELTATFFWRADLRASSVRHARMSGIDLDATLIADADFTGTTGTIGPTSTVLLAGSETPIEAVEALNAAGAQVTLYVPPNQEGPA